MNDGFYDKVRGPLFSGHLTQQQVAGLEEITGSLPSGWPKSWKAYALATAYHETNKTMKPVVEAYWLSEEWRRTHLRYYPWYGRGYVQLTWEKNYKKADDELHLSGSLLTNPNRALEPAVAAKVLVLGMSEGWFTGKKLGDYLHSDAESEGNYTQARRIINGLDRASDISHYAKLFENAL